MKDWIPNFANIKSLQDLAKIVAFPMLMASWILQTGMQIDATSIGLGIIGVPTGDSGKFAAPIFILIFVGKAIWAAAWGAIVYVVIMMIDAYVEGDWALIFAAFFLAFGFYGVAGGERLAASLHLAPIWFYTAIVYAFFLHSTHSDIVR